MGGRALVVDDHPLFRRGLADALRALPGIEDVVERDGAKDGLARWREGAVDLVTVDLSLADGDGFALLRQARDEGLGGAVVVVSMHDDRAYAARARAEGARGYLVKTASVEDTRACLQRVLAGDPAFQLATTPGPATTRPPSTTPSPACAPGSATTPPTPSANTSTNTSTSTSTNTSTLPDGLVSLSPAERRVVVLLGRRLTSRGIAGVLGVSVRTVENHRANISRKLDLRGPHRLLEFAQAAAPLLADDDPTTDP
jgi:DNA-binding NarL/FixJ family response regulator